MRFLAIVTAWLLAGAAFGAGSDGPAPAALKFFEDIKDGNIAAGEVMARSALSPFCGEKKREQIAERLERLGRKLQRERTSFLAAGERIDGKFAAVLVAAESNLNPLDVDVYALGLRREKGTWKVAPVMGSFENSYVGFDETVEKRLAELERWMGAQRVLRVQQLQEKAEERLQAKMNEAVPAELLGQGKPGKVLEAFMQACVDGELAAVLVFLGDADEDDADTQARMRSVVSNGLQGLDPGGQWKLLTDSHVVRVVAEESPGGNEAEVAVLFYNPDDATGVKLARFSLHRRASRWRVELPDRFRLDHKEQLRLRTTAWLELGEEEDKMRKQFGRYFERVRPARREPSVEEAGVAIEALLRDGDLEGLFRCLHRHGDMEDGERRIAYAEVAQLWSMFRDSGKGMSEGLLVDTIRQGKAGLLVFNVVSSAHLDRVKLTPVLLIEDEEGWGISPGVTSRGNFKQLAEELRKDQAVVFAEYTDRRKALESEAASHFLKRFTRASPAGGAEATEADARRLVTSFRALLREGNLLEAFDHCALLDRGEGAWEALTSLSYEYRGAKQSGLPDEELAVQCDGPWAAVSLRVHSGPSDEPDYPMYLVVVTGEGPRIVVDAGLRLVTNKGREVVNNSIWKRIDARLGKDEAGLVRRMFREHVERSTGNRTEWLKNSKSSP